MKRNPKLEGTNLFDCIPQTGTCPNNCSQCFYNHNFYLPINRPHFPSLEEVGDGIVRVNSGHDSNFYRDRVIESTAKYRKRFFNTSIPNFDFPDPIVFTANREEEKQAWLPNQATYGLNYKDKLMFVRLRVSSTNLYHIIEAAELWGGARVPVVLTFMRYHDEKVFAGQNPLYYTKRVSINNVYWCPCPHFMLKTLDYVGRYNSEIKMCGTPLSSLCKNCLNCEKLYYEAKERMKHADTTT